MEWSGHAEHRLVLLCRLLKPFTATHCLTSPRSQYVDRYNRCMSRCLDSDEGACVMATRWGGERRGGGRLLH